MQVSSSASSFTRAGLISLSSLQSLSAVKVDNCSLSVSWNEGKHTMVVISLVHACGRSAEPLSLSFEDVDTSFVPKTFLPQTEVVLFESTGLSSSEDSSSLRCLCEGRIACRDRVGLRLTFGCLVFLWHLLLQSSSLALLLFDICRLILQHSNSVCLDISNKSSLPSKSMVSSFMSFSEGTCGKWACRRSGKFVVTSLVGTTFNWQLQERREIACSLLADNRRAPVTYTFVFFHIWGFFFITVHRC